MQKNSLCFEPFNLSRVRVVYEGKELPGSLDESAVGISNEKTMDALHWYEKLHDVSGFGVSDSMGIDFKDFFHGACIFVIHVSNLYCIIGSTEA